MPPPSSDEGLASPHVREVEAMARDILATLKNEHDALRGLFADLKATTDRGVKTRTDLLERIEAALIPHAKWGAGVLPGIQGARRP